MFIITTTSRTGRCANAWSRGCADGKAVGFFLLSFTTRDDGRSFTRGALFTSVSAGLLLACLQIGKSEKGQTMSSTKIIAIVLIIAGVLGLAYGKFTYTKETHDAKVGPIELSVKDKETVNIPMWAGIGAIVVGAGLLLAGGRKI
jgi:drug/metabolite transporter (DMT)-like permease